MLDPPVASLSLRHTTLTRTAMMTRSTPSPAKILQTLQTETLWPPRKKLMKLRAQEPYTSNRTSELLLHPSAPSLKRKHPRYRKDTATGDTSFKFLLPFLEENQSNVMLASQHSNKTFFLAVAIGTLLASPALNRAKLHPNRPNAQIYRAQALAFCSTKGCQPLAAKVAT